MFVIYKFYRMVDYKIYNLTNFEKLFVYDNWGKLISCLINVYFNGDFYVSSSHINSFITQLFMNKIYYHIERNRSELKKNI